MSKKNSSQRRIEANRRNAQKSTGPRTVEGKANSSRNAVTHGLTANPLPRGCLLSSENEEQFRVLLGEYIATYNPQHRDEYDLLTEAVYAKWGQQRIWLAETAQIEVAMAQNEPSLQKVLPRADYAAHLANGFAHSEAMIRLYLRYNNQLHRQYLRCLKELRELQSLRDPQNAPVPQPETNPDPSPQRELGGDTLQPAESPNEPKPETQAPNEPNLTPAQARLEYMKAEIKRFEDYQARILANKPRS